MLIKTQFGNRPTISDQLFFSLFYTEMGRFQLQAPPATLSGRLSVLFSPLLLILSRCSPKALITLQGTHWFAAPSPPDDRQLVSRSSVPSEAGI